MKQSKLRTLGPLAKKKCCFWVFGKSRENTFQSEDEIRVRTTMQGFIFYLVFLVALIIANLGMISLVKFYLSNGMTELFLDKKIDSSESTTFRAGFTTHEEFWQFLQNPLLNGLYFEKWYDTRNTSVDNLGYIQYQNRLLGLPRILQVRVKENGCKVNNMFKSKINYCYPSYSSTNEATDPFGKALLYPNMSSDDITYTAWHYLKDSSGSMKEDGSFAKYPINGYSIDLANNLTASFAILSDLRTHKWIDRSTRLIAVDFTIYNGNINLFTQIKLMAEFPASGGIVTSSTFHTVKLIRYSDTFDYFVLTCEIICLIYLIVFTIDDIFLMYTERLAFFKNTYNWISIIVNALGYSILGLYIYRYVQTVAILDKLTANFDIFVSFEKAAQSDETANQMSAIMLFFAWLKIFKYVKLSRRMNQLNQTLGNCVKEILSFMVIFFVVFFGYGSFTYLMFGSTLRSFQTFEKSLFTLFRIMVGDFDFITLRHHFPIWGPLIFITFVFFCMFVLFNMFLAIINESYNHVKKEDLRAKPVFMLSDFLKLNYARFVQKLTLRKDRIFDIENVVFGSELASKSYIDYETWRKLLRRKGYAETEIEAIFCKYDRDNDRLLKGSEMIRLTSDLRKAKANVTNEFIDFKEKRVVDENRIDEFMVGDAKNRRNGDDSGAKVASKFMSRANFEHEINRLAKMETSIGKIIIKIDHIFQIMKNIERRNLRQRKDFMQIIEERDVYEFEDRIKGYFEEYDC